MSLPHGRLDAINKVIPIIKKASGAFPASGKIVSKKAGFVIKIYKVNIRIAIEIKFPSKTIGIIIFL